MEWTTVRDFSIALLIGALAGTERESRKRKEDQDASSGLCLAGGSDRNSMAVYHHVAYSNRIHDSQLCNGRMYPTRCPGFNNRSRRSVRLFAWRHDHARVSGISGQPGE
jgi:hypothetical protein